MTSPFAKASFICGILSVLSAIFCTVVFPFIFFGLSIIFACLSKTQKEVPMEKNAKMGMAIGTIGFIINLILLGVCVISWVFILNDPVYRQQFNELCIQMYGMELEELFAPIFELMNR